MNRSVIVVIGVVLGAVACVVIDIGWVRAERAPRAEDFAHRFAPAPPKLVRPVVDYGSIRDLEPVRLRRGS